MNSHSFSLPKESEHSKRTHSMYELHELRKNPELFNRLIDTVMIIERHQSKGMVYEFSFSIEYPTKIGERIVVTGETDFLGCWDPKNGIQLEWQGEGVWKAGIIVVEIHIPEFQYKYVCVKPDSYQWEEGSNRLCRVSSGIGFQSCLSVNMQDSWQHQQNFSI